MPVKKFKIRFSALVLSAALCAASISVGAADDFGQRFTQEAPRAFSDPVDPFMLDQIAPAAGDVTPDAGEADKAIEENGSAVEDMVPEADVDSQESEGLDL